MTETVTDYLEDADTEELRCPECDSTNVEVTGHCFLCFDCGFSLCSM